MEMTVKQMLGQKLIFGFHGASMSEEFKSLIREYKIGNVILFLRNVESAEKLRRLCGEVQELILAETGYPAFIVIDQEGGMVTRLPQDAVNVPGAMAIAATGDPENARIASEILTASVPISPSSIPPAAIIRPSEAATWAASSCMPSAIFRLWDTMTIPTMLFYPFMKSRMAPRVMAAEVAPGS